LEPAFFCRFISVAFEGAFGNRLLPGKVAGAVYLIQRIIYVVSIDEIEQFQRRVRAWALLRAAFSQTILRGLE
jgi:hypothetical protein